MRNTRTWAGESLAGPGGARRRGLFGEEFESLSSAKCLTSAWRGDFNHIRPHSSLGYLTPTEFAARCVGLRPHSTSTAIFPNPYLHNPWYRNLRLVTIESTFATLHLRNRRIKGNGTRLACLTMVFS